MFKGNSKLRSETHLSKSTTLSKDVLHVVNKRIDQLEKSDHRKEESFHNLKHENRIPVGLIPFLLMYVFLNHKFNDDIKLDRQGNKVSKENILKSAEYCARKFSSTDKLRNDKSFLRFCNKRIQSVLKKRSIPDAESNEGIQNILNVYDNIFYKTENYEYQGDFDDEEEKPRDYSKLYQHKNKNNQDDQQLSGYSCDLTENQFCQNEAQSSISKEIVSSQLDGL